MDQEDQASNITTGIQDPDAVLGPDGIRTNGEGVKTNAKGQFVKGSARPLGAGWGGHTRMQIAKFRNYSAELCKEMGFPFDHPVGFLLYIAYTGKDPLVEKYGVGAVHEGAQYESLERRSECARWALPYMAPKISSIEMTGADGEPLFNAERDAAKQVSESPARRALFEAIVAEDAARAAEAGKD